MHIALGLLSSLFPVFTNTLAQQVQNKIRRRLRKIKTRKETNKVSTLINSTKKGQENMF